MTISEVKNFLDHLTGHIMFAYNGYACGVDALSKTSFDMWYGSNVCNAKSVDEVLHVKFFDGKSLTDIWDNVTEVEY